MHRDWLHQQLSGGRSIEAIAREVNRDPSTVAYWVAKHGLVSTYAEKHAARGGISVLVEATRAHHRSHDLAGA
jgi:transposase-like protein